MDVSISSAQTILMLDTPDEQSKFVNDAKSLTADIVSPGGAMSHVAHLLNIHGVFVPSIQVVFPLSDHPTFS